MSWLDKYKNGGQSNMDGLTDEGFDYNGAWGGQFQIGGEVPKRRGVRQNPDGTVSTHLMATETDGKGNWFSFPTLFQNSIPYADDSENWIDMSDRPWEEAYEEAKKRGEVINFGKDKDAAIKFGQGSWKEKMQMGGNVYPVNYVPMAQKGKKVFKKTVTESTSTSKDRIPISSKDIIKTLPGTNVHVNNKGEVVIKDEKGVYKPYNSQQSEIKQGKKKSVKEYEKEQELIKEMQSNNLGLRAPLHYLANPDHMLGDFGNLTGFKPLQTFSNSDEDAQRYNFKSLDPSKSRSERFEDNLNEGLGLLPEASFNLALASLATKTPINALKEAYNPIPIPFNTGMKYDSTDYWKTAENNSDAVELMESNNLIADYFPRRDINNVIGYNKLTQSLPKDLEPYISKRMLNNTREQEIFESSFPVELQEILRNKRTQYLDNKGNVINNNYTRKDLSDDSGVKYEYFNDLNDKVATFSGKKTPEGIFVNGIEVNPNFRRQGVASNIYRNIAKELQQNNQGSLMSRSTQHQFTDKDELGRSIAPANKLWENLVSKGEAEKFVEGMSHIYKLKPLKQGGAIKDDLGQWAHPGEITEINSNDITMQGVPYPVLGISDTGDTKLMQPGKDYKFKGKKVIEYPLAKDGKELVKLNQLTNFTNYNTKQPGGWLDSYK